MSQALSGTQEVKKTIKLAIPVILGELAQMSLHLIDTAMVGKLGYTQLAACGLVMSVVNIPFVLVIGLSFAVSQMVSMANGKGSKAQVAHYFFNGIVLCSLVGLLVAFLLYFGVNILHYLKQDPEVVELAKPFMQLISLSIFPMTLFFALKQYTDGLEMTRTAMLLSFLGLPLNVFINYLLIFGNWGFPKLGLLGAGYGTLITRVIIALALLGVILYHSSYHPYMRLRKQEWKLKWKTQKELLYIGIPSSLQVCMEAGAFAISGILIGMLGAKELAAHQIALSIASSTFMVSLGLAHAGSIRVSNAFGRNDYKKIGVIGRSSIVSAISYGTFCLVLFISLRFFLPSLFNDDQEVIAIAAHLLLWAAVFQISDSVQAISAGLLRGLKDVHFPTVFIAVAYWVIGIPLGYYLTFYQDFGPSGIWIGFISGLTVSAILLSARFLHNKALKKQI